MNNGYTYCYASKESQGLSGAGFGFGVGGCGAGFSRWLSLGSLDVGYARMSPYNQSLYQAIEASDRDGNDVNDKKTRIGSQNTGLRPATARYLEDGVIKEPARATKAALGIIDNNCGDRIGKGEAKNRIPLHEHCCEFQGKRDTQLALSQLSLQSDGCYFVVKYIVRRKILKQKQQ